MGVWNDMNFRNGFEGLIFEKCFFVDWFKEENVDKRSDDLCAYFVEVLIGEDLGKQRECLLGIVASEIIDLLDYSFIEFG
jgi:hypothetical protein